MSINLPKDLEAVLLADAKRRGVSLQERVEALLWVVVESSNSTGECLTCGMAQRGGVVVNGCKRVDCAMVLTGP